MTFGLTPRCQKGLAFIKAFQAKRDMSPTFAEIKAGLRLKSVASVYSLITELEDAGEVRCARLRNGRLRMRGIALIETPRCDHCHNPIGSKACKAAASNKITYSTSPVLKAGAVTHGSVKQPSPRAAVGTNSEHRTS